MEHNQNQKRTQREGKPFYAAIPYPVLKRIGLTWREGLNHYDPSTWDRFYQQNFTPEDFIEAYNHAIDHMGKAMDEIMNGKIHDGDEDHLSHAAVNIMMMMWATEEGKLPNKLESARFALALPLTPKVVDDEPQEGQFIIQEQPVPVTVEVNNPMNKIKRFFGVNKND